MKEIIRWLFGLDESSLSDPIVKLGIILSFVLAAACIAVFLVLLIKKRYRIRRFGNKVWQRTKLITQSCFFILTNSFMIGWLKGTIYTGKLKYICVPGMNCYSCPGAWGACPIGALQAVLDEFDVSKSWFDPVSGTYIQAPLYWVAFYVIGFIMIVGALVGRLVCGLLCPFGWVQDLLYKIPIKKLRLPRDERSIEKSKNPKLVRALLGVDKYLRFAKYAFLIVMVIFLPLVVKANPWFCKYVCPSGMLLGGIPLMSANKTLADAAGNLTLLKLSILAVMIVMSVFLYRPFCRYICPLGALYSLFNPISLYRYGIDDESCNRCKGCSACARACPMGVDPVKNPNSLECIRCGTCSASCPQKAIHAGVRFKTAEGKALRTSRRK
jgi:ferredoxin